jgi:predicted alpha-1,6-mannanase (GH76 family)
MMATYFTAEAEDCSHPAGESSWEAWWLWHFVDVKVEGWARCARFPPQGRSEQGHIGLQGGQIWI